MTQPGPSGSTRGRVLVVDDDAALSEMLGIVLRGEGFEPVFCADGAEALAAFRESKPDLVLLDLMLPGRDGIDVCRAIRAESGTPIVMLTAKSDTVDVVVGLESGADDYVVKPFKPKELVARIRARIRRGRRRAGAGRSSVGDLEIDVTGHTVQARRRGAVADAAGVRPAGRAWPASPGRCSPARSCCRRSGATGTPPTRAWSTCTCSGCAPRSSAIPSVPTSC